MEAIAYYIGGELGVRLGDHSIFLGVGHVDPGFPGVF